MAVEKAAHTGSAPGLDTPTFHGLHCSSLAGLPSMLRAPVCNLNCKKKHVEYQPGYWRAGCFEYCGSNRSFAVLILGNQQAQHIEQMHSFIILVAIATVATSQAQELGADMDGNLVASVKDGKQFIIKQGNATIAVVDEVKQARRKAIENAASIDAEARTARSEANNNAECSDTI
eukprot:gene23131-28199_t